MAIATKLTYRSLPMGQKSSLNPTIAVICCFQCFLSISEIWSCRLSARQAAREIICPLYVPLVLSHNLHPYGEVSLISFYLRGVFLILVYRKCHNCIQ